MRRTDDVFDNHGPSFAVYFEKLSTTYVEIISERIVFTFLQINLEVTKHIACGHQNICTLFLSKTIQEASQEGYKYLS